MLGALLEETRGVLGVALGTDQGELRAIVGTVPDGDASAAVAASVTGELNKVGALLGLGELGVASIKAASTAFVFAQQAGAALVIEMDPRSQLGELETKLCTVAWATRAEAIAPAVNRVPTVPRDGYPVELADAGRDADDDDGFAHAFADAFGEPGDAPGPASVVTAVPAPPAGARYARPTSPSGLTPLPLPPLPPTNAVPRARPTPPPPPPSAATRPPPPPTSPARAQPPATGSAMSFKAVGGPVFTGDLEEFALPDLLEFLRNTHRTGLLECVGDAGIGTVQLSRGLIVGADSPNAIDLREHFLTSPDIDTERRHQLAALPVECFSDDAIDVTLVARGVISPQDAEAARTARVYSAFREMMAWTSGRFSFDPGVAITTTPLALSAQSVLMHIYQEQDEQNR